MNWVLSGWGNEIKNETVEINFSGSNVLNNVKPGTLFRIDDDNCNPPVIWQQMGEPFYPNTQQMSRLINASNTFPMQINVDSSPTDSITFKLNLPVFGLALIVVDL
eukprot:UN05993